MFIRRTLIVLAAAIAVIAPTAAAVDAAPSMSAEGTSELDSIEVLSSPPDQVSGDDARLRITVPPGLVDKVGVYVGDVDQSGHFAEVEPGVLEGVVDELDLGDNEVTVVSTRRNPRSAERSSITLTNHPITGPIFSGPQQQPFFCSTEGDYRGAELAGPIDDDCSMETAVSFKYRTTAGSWADYDPDAPRPADLATTTTMHGDTVDYIVRWERGTINRFIYSIAMLSPGSQDVAEPDLSAWNDRLIYYFQGGVAIGHYQGDPSGSRMLYDHGLGLGYAVVYSTGTKTGTHYNLVVGGETATMVKDRFVSAYGDPDYTVGVGGSGGGIQQYVYAQNHPGLIDAGVPQYSYPDMITQAIHVGDCELLERWMDFRLFNGETMWADWTNRSLLEGMNASNTVNNPAGAVMPPGYPSGSSECISAWRGLSALVLNPHFGTAPGITPAQQAAVEWTHFADAQNVYGRNADGFANSIWDNVGVQYGLGALVDGEITPEQFLNLNANVGSWKNEPDMVQEGCPFLSFLCPNPADLAGLAPFPDIWPNLLDPWSARNMALSPDGGATPAPRRTADPGAIDAVMASGLVNRGDIEIPMIDWRHYLERELDMHNSHQSFAARQRLLNHDGDASNQVIWFTDAIAGSPRFDQTPMAFEVIDEWMANIAANPDGGVAGNKPDRAVDTCFDVTGEVIHAGDDAWAGILDGGADGPCSQQFPPFSTSRIVAGAPITGDVFKCGLKSVADAIADGTYGSWTPTAEQQAQLEAIFPEGVCSY